MENDTLLVSFIAGPLIALLVGFVTKLHASAAIKSTVNLLLSAVAGVIVQYATNTGAESVRDYLLAIFITWVTSISIHEGFWKPTDISGVIQRAAPNFGIGPEYAKNDPDKAI